MIKRIVLILVLLITCRAQAELEVHFLDVGQGDAALLLCDGEAMLIDGGPSGASQFIYSYIRQHTDALDYIVATHPHEDHVGGLAAALNAVPVDLILSPVEEWDGKVFRDVQRYAQMQHTPVAVPLEGDCFPFGQASFTILHCWPEAWDVNDMSIVLRVDYGLTSFLFTGDAEEISEYMMLDSGMPLSVDVLKVGHHGSSTSSTKTFIQTVAPAYAIISCGKNNRYGHPSEETLQTLNSAQILRTDQSGTIVFHSDGENIWYDMSKRADENLRSVNQKHDSPDDLGEGFYIGNKKSKKFHCKECQGVQSMSDKNKVIFASRADAIASGYVPCKMCRP